MPNDLDGVGLVGRRHLDGLEAAFERAVLLDGLAELGRRGGADALDFAARERRLQDVGGVERAFGRARAHQRVQLVDEDDGVLVLHQLFHDGLEALFELAAILGAGHDQRKVERQNALVGQEAEGTSPSAMRCARPSTMAVLPTPGSPISTGLFLVRRQRIWTTRSSS
jgi:hypothetical protein